MTQEVRKSFFDLGLSESTLSVHSSPSESVYGCWKIEMTVPWKDDIAVVAERLWSMLSTADKVNARLRKTGGHTRPSSVY